MVVYGIKINTVAVYLPWAEMESSLIFLKNMLYSF